MRQRGWVVASAVLLCIGGGFAMVYHGLAALLSSDSSFAALLDEILALMDLFRHLLYATLVVLWPSVVQSLAIYRQLPQLVLPRAMLHTRVMRTFGIRAYVTRIRYFIACNIGSRLGLLVLLCFYEALIWGMRI